MSNVAVLKDELSYEKARRLDAEKRLTAECIRAGRAEGALDVVSQQYATAQLRVATLSAEVAALRGQVGDLRDQLDERVA